jgi:hypothetical protein
MTIKIAMAIFVEIKKKIHPRNCIESQETENSQDNIEKAEYKVKVLHVLN